MRIAFLIVVASSLFSVQSVQAASGQFDGVWAVTLETPQYKDPTGLVVQAYTFQFPAHVRGGVLHGERGTRGQPAWLELDGTIQDNGTATLHARGITGRREYNLAHVETGRPYEYDVAARFTAKDGNGRRIGGRIGLFRFAKE